MLNLATEFYTFRHTAVLTSLQEPDSYTDENFGNINDNDGYVIDPYFFKKTVEGAKDFKNEDGFFAQALVQATLTTAIGQAWLRQIAGHASTVWRTVCSVPPS